MERRDGTPDFRLFLDLVFLDLVFAVFYLNVTPAKNEGLHLKSSPGILPVEEKNALSQQIWNFLIGKVWLEQHLRKTFIAIS